MNTDFEPHICAYLDILGGAKLFSTATTDQNSVERFLASIRGFERRLSGSRPGQAIVKAFSDNVFAAIPIAGTRTIGEEQWIAYFLNEIAIQVQQIFLMYELPLRGGITIGDLYKEKDVVLGPGALEAVRLEESADYPRVVISDSVRTRLSKGGEVPADMFVEHPLLYTGADGVTSLNYLCLYPWLLKPHEEIIERRLSEFAGEPGVRRKYEWLESYHLGMEGRMRDLRLL